MDKELDGIELETIDLNNTTDEIVLPDVDNEENDGIENTEIETENNTKVTDEEKESLKRGVNAERKARKEAERKNKELEARIKALEEANTTPEKSTLDELIESGIDETIAKTIATAIDKKKTDNSDLAKELANVKFENELNKKSREVGFEDITEFSDEIKELVDKGLSLEQSYYAVTYNQPKSKNTKTEIERKVEAKLQNNHARKEILGNYNDNTGTNSKSNVKLNLTDEEKGIAAMAGMSIEEYVAFRDMKSIKDN